MGLIFQLGFKPPQSHRPDGLERLDTRIFSRFAYCSVVTVYFSTLDDNIKQVTTFLTISEGFRYSTEAVLQCD